MTHAQSFPHFFLSCFWLAARKTAAKTKNLVSIQSYSTTIGRFKFLFSTGMASLSFAFSFYWRLACFYSGPVSFGFCHFVSIEASVASQSDAECEAERRCRAKLDQLPVASAGSIVDNHFDLHGPSVRATTEGEVFNTFLDWHVDRPSARPDAETPAQNNKGRRMRLEAHW
ncbi:hypothetical protein [Nitrobacter sp.]|uniref:hypothetical protein n=1 Tax=Nitrobacter sp. TaxID=29420 RepID=UPI00399D6257